jgi:predicted 3-demethylubiquinone-9 3-methyltransferase (glyoxalase superfamily)
MMNYLGGADAEGAQRATQAMLGMKKIDLAAMKRAYENA